jgi:hypothetical protein
VAKIRSIGLDPMPPTPATVRRATASGPCYGCALGKPYS